MKKVNKNVFQKIVEICKNYEDEERDLNQIYDLCMDRIIRYEWEEKYGIKTDAGCKPYSFDFYKIDEYQSIEYFRNGYRYREVGGRFIACSDNGKQPVDEWLYCIRFPAGAYTFGENYDQLKPIYMELIKELKKYKPDYWDFFNKEFFWKLENTNKIMKEFKKIFKKYEQKAIKQLKVK